MLATPLEVTARVSLDRSKPLPMIPVHPKEDVAKVHTPASIFPDDPVLILHLPEEGARVVFRYRTGTGDPHARCREQGRGNRAFETLVPRLTVETARATCGESLCKVSVRRD
jgi:hypothetical protein